MDQSEARELVGRYRSRGKAVRVGVAVMCETTRRPAADALQMALEMTGAQIISCTKEVRQGRGKHRTKTVWTIIAIVPDDHTLAQM